MSFYSIIVKKHAFLTFYTLLRAKTYYVLVGELVRRQFLHNEHQCLHTSKVTTVKQRLNTTLLTQIE